MGLVHWSVDAASNDTIDPPINFLEGQPPPTLNNSMRGVMAALKGWHNDNAGSLVATRAAGNAYAISTGQDFSKLAGVAATTAHTIAFTVSAANTGPATLSLDGQTARPLLRGFRRGLAPGDLSPDIAYVARYVPATQHYAIIAPFIDRPGRIDVQATATADPGWIPCDGRLLSRFDYSALFAAIGPTFGAGDGATTFNVPNFTGRAPFGPGGTLGAVGASGGSETVALTAGQLASHTHTGSTAAAGGHDHVGMTTNAGSHNHGGTTNGAGGHAHGATAVSAGAHTHTGTTASSGSHGHAIQYDVGSAGSGATNRVVRDISPNGVLNAGGASDLSGVHTHDFTTASSGDHSHTITVDAVGDHVHPIPTEGAHAHAITPAPDHTHGLSLNATGNGEGHPNMPPGLVVAFVIKA